MVAIDTAALENHFATLEPQLPARLALRSALRVLPILAIRSPEGGDRFNYWPQSDQARHMFSLFRASAAASCVKAAPGTTGTVIDFPTAATKMANAIYGAEAAASATVSTAASSVAFAIAFSASSSIIVTNASGAAAFAIDNALDAAAPFLSAAYGAFTHDLAQISQPLDGGRTGADAGNDVPSHDGLSVPDVLYRAPLWPGDIPKDVHEAWSQMQDDLRGLEAGFDGWIDWYSDQLAGQQNRLIWERNCLMLTDRELSWPVGRINAYLAAPDGRTAQSCTNQHAGDNDESKQSPPAAAVPSQIHDNNVPSHPVADTIGSKPHGTLPDLMFAMRHILTTLAHEAASANVAPDAVQLLERIAGLIPDDHPTAVELILLNHAHLALHSYERAADDAWPGMLAHKLHATTIILGQLIELFPSWASAVVQDDVTKLQASGQPAAEPADILNYQLAAAVEEFEAGLAQSEPLPHTQLPNTSIGPSNHSDDEYERKRA